MRDASLRAEQAVEDSNIVAIAEGREEWYTQAAGFWAAQAGRSELDAKKDGPKRYRSKAKAWVTACDHMLVTMTGVGLKDFAQPEPEQRGDPRGWPVLTICLDQGSGGWAGGMWLQHQAGVNALLLFDVSHRGWNDACLALRGCGMWSTVLLLQVCMNLDHGPWQDGKWHKELREATSLCQSLVSPNSCPMLRDCSRRYSTTGARTSASRRTASQRRSSAHSATPLRACRSRLRCADGSGLWSPGKSRHTRLLIHIFLLQQLGILTNSMKTRFGLSLSASKDFHQGDMAKETTAKDIESVRQLRVKCRNS